MTRNNRRASILTLLLSSKNDIVIEMDDSNYAGILRQDKAVLVDACAPWCGPCKLIEPVLKSCAQKWSNHVLVARFDMESPNNSMKGLKMEFILQKVMPRSLPSLILFQNGKVVTNWNGVISEEELDELLVLNLDGVTGVPKRKGVGTVNFSSRLDDDDYMLSSLND